MGKFFSLILLFTTLHSCEIHTSPPDYFTMKLAPQDGWYYNVIPIRKSNNIKNFEDAFRENDTSIKNYIKDTICKKLDWSGVVNYNLKWQITNSDYVFIVTFDAFKYK